MSESSATEFLTEEDAAFLFSALTAYEQALRGTALTDRTPQQRIADLGHIGTIHKRFSLNRMEFTPDELAVMYRAVDSQRTRLTASMDAGLPQGDGEQAGGYLTQANGILRKIRHAFQSIELELNDYLAR